MRKKKHLTIEEKRDWLAEVFRDPDGIYTQADKFKAMVEDTRLAELEAQKDPPPRPQQPEIPADILAHLPPPLS